MSSSNYSVSRPSPSEKLPGPLPTSATEDALARRRAASQGKRKPKKGKEQAQQPTAPDPEQPDAKTPPSDGEEHAVDYLA